MPQVGFEHTIPVFDRAKMIHAIDCAATVVGLHCFCLNLRLFKTNKHYNFVFNINNYIDIQYDLEIKFNFKSVVLF
jgi:hypothetical protein